MSLQHETRRGLSAAEPACERSATRLAADDVQLKTDKPKTGPAFPPLKPSDLPAREELLAAYDRPNPKIDLNNPLATARAFARHMERSAPGCTLLRWRGGYALADESCRRRVDISDTQARHSAWLFLERCTDKHGRPLAPRRAHVNEMLEALSAVLDGYYHWALARRAA